MVPDGMIMGLLQYLSAIIIGGSPERLAG
jgi:hypothetical protein